MENFYLAKLCRWRHLLFTLTILIALIKPQHCSSQIYGYTLEYDQPWNLGSGAIVWWRIDTGPTDSGSFTHLGTFVKSDNLATQAKAAIYSDGGNGPQNLLADITYTVTNGEYNTMELTTPLALSPSTTYWIAFRGNQNLKTGGSLAGNSYPYPYRYVFRSYVSSWPSPPTNLLQATSTRHHALYVIANNVALPVELLSFDVEEKGDNVNLTWETASEINNDGWNIQKTKNGYTWETIGWVDGVGDSSSNSKYTFLDKNPTDGLNIYRLEQVDFDGTKAYSDVKTIAFKSSKRSISPNPFVDHLTIKGYEDGDFSIIDNSGRTLKTGVLLENGQLDLSDLVPGLYRCIISSGGTVESYSIVKE